MDGLTEKGALIALSGGVDSAVAALLTVRSGIECAGAVMELFGGGGSARDAEAAANRLGIPFYVCDFRAQFAERVVKHFIGAYRRGMTPNPCVGCNKQMKFGLLLDKAEELGKCALVTGHYAKVERDTNGRFLLKTGADRAKDQSYVLYGLTQRQLARVMFPLGDMTKQQVRELAREAGLGNSGKKESQDICFVPNGDYAGFIEAYTGEKCRPGRFVDTGGSDLGEHRGVEHYTVGQRRGLGISAPEPTYVLGISAADNTVTVGGGDKLYSKTLYARDINLIPFDKIDAPIRAQVKIRYSQTARDATVRQIDGDTLFVEFDEPQRAVTSGQAAVIYDGGTVVGGGTIA